MAPLGTLYGKPDNPRVTKSLVVAAIGGVELNMIDNFEMGVSNKTPEYLAKFPLGKTPAFESEVDGKPFLLTESNALMQYFAAKGNKASQLLGATPEDQGQIARWPSLVESEMFAPAMPLIYMTIAPQANPYDEAVYNKALEGTMRGCKMADDAVAGGKKFLVGDHFTVADAAVGAFLHRCYGFLLDEELRKQVPNLEAYLKGLHEIPEVHKVFGELHFVEKRAMPPGASA